MFVLKGEYYKLSKNSTASLKPYVLFFLSRKHSCVCLSLCLSVSSPSPCAGHLLFAKDIGLETRKKSELVKRRWQLKIAYWSEQQSQKPKMISFTL